MLRTILMSAALASLAIVPMATGKERQTRANTQAQIDYRGFAQLTEEIEAYRADRLVTLEQFQRMAAADDTLILDARSPAAYAEGHIDGAVNLTFTDFTAESLREAIGANPNRRILIYCNNNFSNNQRPVMLKAIQLALNIQTFINLYGYGYRNVYELGDVVDFNDPEVRWVTS